TAVTTRMPSRINRVRFMIWSSKILSSISDHSQSLSAVVLSCSSCEKSDIIGIAKFFVKLRPFFSGMLYRSTRKGGGSWLVIWLCEGKSGGDAGFTLVKSQRESKKGARLPRLCALKWRAPE